MEHLLQYVWKHKLFPLQPLQTTGGLPVEVIDPGLHNSNAGPDFFNAKLKIDGTLWVGNVEVHSLSSDWFRHGHDRDRAYDSVILHVAGKVDTDIVRPGGESLPQLQLNCPDAVRTHYEELRNADRYPCCTEVVGALPKIAVHSWLTSLQTERLQQKALQIEKRLERCDRNWEDAFFVTLARNFGFGLNGDAFERWAGTLPFRAVDKHRDDLFQIEAFFFGQAGLLDEIASRANASGRAVKPQVQTAHLAASGTVDALRAEAKADGLPLHSRVTSTLETVPADLPADEYYFRLQKEYRYLRHKFGFDAQMQASDWRFLRLRPGNFPHIRLAQLAWLYRSGSTLFSRLMEGETLETVRGMLAARTSDYWTEHYLFHKPSPRREKTLGAKSVDLLVINTVVPFLYAYGLHKADERLCDRALRFLDELKAEDNHIVRSWSAAGLAVTSAADSQALVQLRTAYCEQRKCLYCRFGYEYMRR
ncbi:DUF2851 family protein [Bacteroides pyogenes]|uniref:DUF2851 family protein n=1 Tax=Bacteroides pyogenes TaxID=310300 RepID=UPI00242A3CE7|nr:DUF2851 family protein [Bacteroides pyogenes]MCI7071590.1 DUF2851 family protein [Bacteroides pyogenes]MDY5353565.1 DUF2851 family protein [Bacteroides pyogenes]